MGMIIGGVASLASGIMGAHAAKSASRAQADAAAQQLDFSKQVYGDQKAAFAPYLQSGTQGMQAYNSLLGLGAAPEGFAGYQQSPGYQFQLNQGLDAAKSAAAAHGGMGSGATLQALDSYGQGMANQDYQTYLNRLQGVSASGQAAAGGQAAAAQQYGQNGLAAMGSAGDARASGIMGGYNALASGINNAISGYGYMQGSGNAGQFSLVNLFGNSYGAMRQSGGMAPSYAGAIPGGTHS